MGEKKSLRRLSKTDVNNFDIATMHEIPLQFFTYLNRLFIWNEKKIEFVKLLGTSLICYNKYQINLNCTLGENVEK